MPTARPACGRNRWMVRVPVQHAPFRSGRSRAARRCAASVAIRCLPRPAPRNAGRTNRSSRYSPRLPRKCASCGRTGENGRLRHRLRRSGLGRRACAEQLFAQAVVGRPLRHPPAVVPGQLGDQLPDQRHVVDAGGMTMTAAGCAAVIGSAGQFLLHQLADQAHVGRVRPAPASARPSASLHVGRRSGARRSRRWRGLISAKIGPSHLRRQVGVDHAIRSVRPRPVRRRRLRTY